MTPRAYDTTILMVGKLDKLKILYNKKHDASTYIISLYLLLFLPNITLNLVDILGGQSLGALV